MTSHPGSGTGNTCGVGAAAPFEPGDSSQQMKIMTVTGAIGLAVADTLSVQTGWRPPAGRPRVRCRRGCHDVLRRAARDKTGAASARSPRGLGWGQRNRRREPGRPADGNAAACLTEGEAGTSVDGQTVAEVLAIPQLYDVNVHDAECLGGAIRGRLQEQSCSEPDRSSCRHRAVRRPAGLGSRSRAGQTRPGNDETPLPSGCGASSDLQDYSGLAGLPERSSSGMALSGRALASTAFGPRKKPLLGALASTTCSSP